MERIGAIDAWASLITPEGATQWPEEFLHIFRRYKVDRRMLDGMTLEQMLEEMDEADVDIAVFSAFGYGDLHVVTNETVGEVVAVVRVHLAEPVAVDLPAGQVGFNRRMPYQGGQGPLV